eukprot:40389-Amorphochlora_amoeboformis.AAC.1
MAISSTSQRRRSGVRKGGVGVGTGSRTLGILSSPGMIAAMVLGMSLSVTLGGEDEGEKACAERVI